MANDNSKTSLSELAPFLLKATQRYCLIALTKSSLPRNTGPLFCRMDSNSCSESTLDRISWHLGWGGGPVESGERRGGGGGSRTANLGSMVPSGSGFIDSLHRDRNTRKASFCRMCANTRADLVERGGAAPLRAESSEVAPSS